MFPSFHDLVAIAIDPLPWSVLLLACGILLWKRRRLSLSCCLASFLLLLAFSATSVSSALLPSLERRYPDLALENTPKAQAIVVLGGAVHQPSPQHPGSGLINSSDRVLHAFRLYHAGKAPFVLCSGGGAGPAEAPVMGGLLREWGVPPEAILLEERSLDTHQNALFSYAILQARGIHHILLVTSATHMPRAAAVFRKAGFEVSPSPADYGTGWHDDASSFGVMNWVPEAGALRWSEVALREWIGMLTYRLRGWV